MVFDCHILFNIIIADGWICFLIELNAITMLIWVIVTNYNMVVVYYIITSVLNIDTIGLIWKNSDIGCYLTIFYYTIMYIMT